uniref:Uncharacterized protein n=1 Tax=Romanomermis culicivorax TaxID=13658 RepID=A0A915IJP5_ROMCU
MLRSHRDMYNCRSQQKSFRRQNIQSFLALSINEKSVCASDSVFTRINIIAVFGCCSSLSVLSSFLASSNGGLGTQAKVKLFLLILLQGVASDKQTLKMIYGTV